MPMTPALGGGDRRDCLTSQLNWCGQVRETLTQTLHGKRLRQVPAVFVPQHTLTNVNTHTVAANDSVPKYTKGTEVAKRNIKLDLGREGTGE